MTGKVPPSLAGSGDFLGCPRCLGAFASHRVPLNLYPKSPVQEGALSLCFSEQGPSGGLTHRVSDCICEVIKTVTQMSLPRGGGRNSALTVCQ